MLYQDVSCTFIASDFAMDAAMVSSLNHEGRAAAPALPHIEDSTSYLDTSDASHAYDSPTTELIRIQDAIVGFPDADQSSECAEPLPGHDLRPADQSSVDTPAPGTSSVLCQMTSGTKELPKEDTSVGRTEEVAASRDAAPLSTLMQDLALYCSVKCEPSWPVCAEDKSDDCTSAFPSTASAGSDATSSRYPLPLLPTAAASEVAVDGSLSLISSHSANCSKSDALNDSLCIAAAGGTKHPRSVSLFPSDSNDVRLWASHGERAAFLVARNACLTKLRRLSESFPSWAQTTATGNTVTSLDWHTGAILQCDTWTDIGVYLPVFESLDQRAAGSADQMTTILSDTIARLDAIRCVRDSAFRKDNRPCRFRRSVPVGESHATAPLLVAKEDQDVFDFSVKCDSFHDTSQSSISTTATPSPTSATSATSHFPYRISKNSRVSDAVHLRQHESSLSSDDGDLQDIPQSEKVCVPTQPALYDTVSPTFRRPRRRPERASGEGGAVVATARPISGDPSRKRTPSLKAPVGSSLKSVSELPVVPHQHRQASQRTVHSGILRFEPLPGPVRPSVSKSEPPHGSKIPTDSGHGVTSCRISQGTPVASSLSQQERDSSSRRSDGPSAGNHDSELDLPYNSSAVTAALTLLARTIDVSVDHIKSIVSCNNTSQSPQPRLGTDASPNTLRRRSLRASSTDSERSVANFGAPHSALKSGDVNEGSQEPLQETDDDLKHREIEKDPVGYSEGYSQRERKEQLAKHDKSSLHSVLLTETVLTPEATHFVNPKSSCSGICSTSRRSPSIVSSPLHSSALYEQSPDFVRTPPFPKASGPLPSQPSSKSFSQGTRRSYRTENCPAQRSMKGVSFDRSKRNWEASWLDARTGKRVKKCFSEGRWGSSARDMAILARKEAEDSGVISIRQQQQQFSPSTFSSPLSDRRNEPPVTASIAVGRPAPTSPNPNHGLLVPITPDCAEGGPVLHSGVQHQRGHALQVITSRRPSARPLSSVDDDALLQQVAVQVAHRFPQAALAKAVRLTQAQPFSTPISNSTEGSPAGVGQQPRPLHSAEVQGNIVSRTVKDLEVKDDQVPSTSLCPSLTSTSSALVTFPLPIPHVDTSEPHTHEMQEVPSCRPDTPTLVVPNDQLESVSSEVTARQLATRADASVLSEVLEVVAPALENINRMDSFCLVNDSSITSSSPLRSMRNIAYQSAGCSMPLPAASSVNQNSHTTVSGRIAQGSPVSCSNSAHPQLYQPLTTNESLSNELCITVEPSTTTPVGETLGGSVTYSRVSDVVKLVQDYLAPVSDSLTCTEKTSGETPASGSLVECPPDRTEATRATSSPQHQEVLSDQYIIQAEPTSSIPPVSPSLPMCVSSELQPLPLPPASPKERTSPHIHTPREDNEQGSLFTTPDSYDK